MPLYEHVMIARQDLSNTQAEALIQDQQKPQGSLRPSADRCTSACRPRDGTPDAPS